MSLNDRTRDRVRWRCRRGLLELDLVLNAFLEQHYDSLDASGLEAFKSLLARSDHELLDLVMGCSESANIHESRVLSLVRRISPAPPGLPAAPGAKGG